MATATKFEQSTALKESLEEVSAVVLMEFKGLSVSDTEDLRAKFREAGCFYKVYKNSVLKYAVKGTKHEPMESLLKGSTSIAYNTEDPGAPARVAKAFAKDHEDGFKIKGGVMDGSLLDVAGIGTLADMPGPNELKAMLLSLFNQPATSFVRVLNAPAQGLLNVLSARKDKLDGGEVAA